MRNEDIQVKIGADTGALDRGMDAVAGVVRTKSNLVNEILRKNAEEAIAIARKQAREMEDAAKKQAEAVERAHKESANRLGDIGRDLQSRLMGLFSIGAIVGFIKSTKQAVTEAEASYRGLESVANYTGIGIGNAMKAAGQLAADGLMTTAEASKALQNLLSRGYSLDQAINTLTRLKDAAAFNRQANLEMGEAVVNATEGLKNENSVLVDNAGVTKNVAKMWDEYAAKVGKSTNQLTIAEKIQAEYNGVMSETEAQVGNAAKASEGLQGKTAQMTAKFQELKIMIGERLTPAFTMLAELASWVIGKFDTLTRIIQISGAQIAKWGADVGAVFSAVSNWDFSKLRGQLAQNAAILTDQVDDIMGAKAGSSFAPSQDTGRRKGPDAAPVEKPTKGSKGGSKKKDDGPIDVFDNESFVTDDKGVADIIRQQYAAVNSLQGEIVREAEQTAQKLTQTSEKSAAERMRVDRMWADHAVETELSRINSAEDAARTQVDLGLMTRAELLVQEEEFERRRTEIQMVALQERLATIDPNRDPVAFAETSIALEELERQHQENLAQIRAEALPAQVEPINSMISTIENAMVRLGTTMLTNWRGVGAALKGVLSSIGQSIIQEVILKPLAARIAAFAKERILALAGIGAKAAEAGAGAASSQASIPYVGPVLALAAMASVFAGVMGMSANVPSAAQGFDIPSGINPMTQLHEKEMVLPAKHADVIRRMADGESGASANTSGEQSVVVNQTFNIQALDGPSVRGVLMDHQRDLIDVIRNAQREFL